MQLAGSFEASAATLAEGVDCCDCNQASPDNHQEQLISGLADQTGVRTLALADVYLSVSESDAQTDAAATFLPPLFLFAVLLEARC